MPRLKKPLREERMRVGPSGRKFFPDDPFPAGDPEPEARPVKPKLPVKRKRTRKASLKRNPWKFDG